MANSPEILRPLPNSTIPFIVPPPLLGSCELRNHSGYSSSMTNSAEDYSGANSASSSRRASR